jgi:hypothetical protein
MFALPGSIGRADDGITIMGPTIYAGTILLYLCVRRQLDRNEVGCDLGDFRVPLARVSTRSVARIVVWVRVTWPKRRIGPELRSMSS